VATGSTASRSAIGRRRLRSAIWAQWPRVQLGLWSPSLFPRATHVKGVRSPREFAKGRRLSCAQSLAEISLLERTFRSRSQRLAALRDLLRVRGPRSVSAFTLPDGSAAQPPRSVPGALARTRLTLIGHALPIQ